MPTMPSCRLIAAALLVIVFVNPLLGGDWPMWRHDAGRTAASPEELPAELHLQWERELPPPRPAFPGEVRLRYDATFDQEFSQLFFYYAFERRHTVSLSY